MSLSAFFSSFFPVTYSDAAENKEEPESKKAEEELESKGNPEEDSEAEDENKESNDEGKEDGEEAAKEEEEDEPEDLYPAIREECQNSKKCAPLTHHFQHCQERVQSGQGLKHEDCVEELCTCS